MSPKCRVCGRFFKTQGGFRSHLNMVKRTGSHYPRNKGGYSGYRRKSYGGYRKRRYSNYGRSY